MIYFVRHSDSIKIGYTEKPTQRMYQLKGNFPGAELLKVIEGSRAKERELHEMFRAYQQQGEWFEAVPALTEFIGSLEPAKSANNQRHELEEVLGSGVKRIRLNKNMTQAQLAEKACVSLSALRHLEGGTGASITTLIKVAEAVGKTEWVLSFSPYITINPLHMVGGKQRQRARGRRQL